MDGNACACQSRCRTPGSNAVKRVGPGLQAMPSLLPGLSHGARSLLSTTLLGHQRRSRLDRALRCQIERIRYPQSVKAGESFTRKSEHHPGCTCLAARFFPRALDMYSRRLLGTPESFKSVQGASRKCRAKQAPCVLGDVGNSAKSLQPRHCSLSKIWSPKCTRCRGDRSCLSCSINMGGHCLRRPSMLEALRQSLSSSASSAELLDATLAAKLLRSLRRVSGTSEDTTWDPFKLAANLHVSACAWRMTFKKGPCSNPTSCQAVGATPDLRYPPSFCSCGTV